MHSKIHLGGYGGFVFGLGAIAMVLVACANYDEAGLQESTGGGGGQAPAATGAGGSKGAIIPEIPEFPDGGTTDADPLFQEDGGSDPSDAGVVTLPPACADLNKDPQVLYMSADDSNSMGSPGHVREIINIGFEPNPAKIRTYEFLNYYRIGYKAPMEGSLSIFPEMEITAEPTIADFQIAIRSFDAYESRRPMNFTFLVDTSGSMKGPGLERAKAAVNAIASKLVQGDIVSFLTTNATSTKLIGHTIVAPDDPTLVNLVKGLTTGGNTDLATALTEAYSLADLHRSDSRMNRVIFISDGGVNEGVTDTTLIAEKAADAQSEGIYLVGIGTGPALSYNDQLMNEVTDAGRGAYVYLDSVDEARRILADRFDETMDIAARSVQVELTLPWYFKVEGKSTEDALTSTKLEAQNLAPNDAMVFLLQTTACDPSFYNANDEVRIRVMWRTARENQPRLTDFPVPLKSIVGQNSPTMAKGRAIVAYAEALKGCGFDQDNVTLCKNDTERKAVTKKKLVAAHDLATLAKNGMPDAELDEILQIIETHTLYK
jgi:Ca-activated chloride channel family protein